MQTAGRLEKPTMTTPPGLVVLVACHNDKCSNYALGPWRVLEENGQVTGVYYCAKCGGELTTVPAVYQPTLVVAVENTASL